LIFYDTAYTVGLEKAPLDIRPEIHYIENSAISKEISMKVR